MPVSSLVLMGIYLQLMICLVFCVKIIPSTCCLCTMQPTSYRCTDRCPWNYFHTQIEEKVPDCEAAQLGFPDHHQSLTPMCPVQTKESELQTAEGITKKADDGRNSSSDDEGEVGRVTCLPCHQACNGCRGAGSANCLLCAASFQRSPGHPAECVGNAGSGSQQTTSPLKPDIHIFLLSALLILALTTMFLMTFVLMHFRRIARRYISMKENQKSKTAYFPITNSEQDTHPSSSYSAECLYDFIDDRLGKYPTTSEPEEHNSNSFEKPCQEIMYLPDCKTEVILASKSSHCKQYDDYREAELSICEQTTAKTPTSSFDIYQEDVQKGNGPSRREGLRVTCEIAPPLPPRNHDVRKSQSEQTTVTSLPHLTLESNSKSQLFTINDVYVKGVQPLQEDYDHYNEQETVRKKTDFSDVSSEHLSELSAAVDVSSEHLSELSAAVDVYSEHLSELSAAVDDTEEGYNEQVAKSFSMYSFGSMNSDIPTDHVQSQLWPETSVDTDYENITESYLTRLSKSPDSPVVIYSYAAQKRPDATRFDGLPKLPWSDDGSFIGELLVTNPSLTRDYDSSSYSSSLLSLQYLDQSQSDDWIYMPWLEAAGYITPTVPVRLSLAKSSGHPEDIAAQFSKNLSRSYFTSMTTQTSLDDKENARPLFSSTWQKDQLFSGEGGILQLTDSDVRLEIPAGAIEKGTDVRVRVAISTELTSAYGQFQSLPRKEYIASPVVEYFAGVSFKFQKAVQIFLPHFLPLDFCPDHVSVYAFRCDKLGHVVLYRLKLDSKDNAQTSQTDVFWLGNNHIHISTDHFSGFFCTNCQNRYLPQELNLLVFARQVEKSRGGRVVDVRLEIWDNRLAIKDFEKECFQRAQTVNEQGMRCIDRSSLPPPESELQLSQLRVGAQIDFKSEEDWRLWCHAKRRNGQPLYPDKVTLLLSTIWPCECNRPSIPKRISWQLTNQNAVSPEDACECIIDVGYVTTGDTKEDIGLDFLPHPGLDFLPHPGLDFLPHPRSVTIDVSVASCELSIPSPDDNELAKKSFSRLANNNRSSAQCFRPPSQTIRNDLSGGNSSQASSTAKNGSSASTNDERLEGKPVRQAQTITYIKAAHHVSIQTSAREEQQTGCEPSASAATCMSAGTFPNISRSHSLGDIVAEFHTVNISDSIGMPLHNNLSAQRPPRHSDSIGMPPHNNLSSQRNSASDSGLYTARGEQLHSPVLVSEASSYSFTHDDRV